MDNNITQTTHECRDQSPCDYCIFNDHTDGDCIGDMGNHCQNSFYTLKKVAKIS